MYISLEMTCASASRVDHAADATPRRPKHVPWTKEEDARLQRMQEKYGNKWSTVAGFLPGRTGQQCAQRWRHRVNPNIRRDKWTKEEDDKVRGNNNNAANEQTLLFLRFKRDPPRRSRRLSSIEFKNARQRRRRPGKGKRHRSRLSQRDKRERFGTLFFLVGLRFCSL